MQVPVAESGPSRPGGSPATSVTLFCISEGLGSFVTQQTHADTCFVPDEAEAGSALMGLTDKCPGSPTRQIMLRLLPSSTGLLRSQKIRRQGG